MEMALNLGQQAQLLQILDDQLAAGIALHAAVFPRFFGHMGIQADNHHLVQVVAQADLEVVRVMSRCDLHHARAEAGIDIIVGDDRDFPVHQRHDHLLADQMLEPWIVGADGDRRVTEHCLRPGCGYLHVPAAVGEGIVDIVELAFHFFMVDFDVGQSGAAVWAPVDAVIALVNQALFVEPDKDLPDRPGTAFVHGEAQAVPIAG